METSGLQGVKTIAERRVGHPADVAPSAQSSQPFTNEKQRQPEPNDANYPLGKIKTISHGQSMP
jgi:hypothetical protein